ncbi:hypothetical protein B0H11DRAFT_2375200 [Mycena galericulata]|nr:hypothetical protein B0H11DRAFT_2375200 [Mycena galericulata]
MSSHPQHRPSLSLFPTELLDEIAQRTPRRDLPALCGAGDRRVHAVCLPYLYKSVHIYSDAALERFCDTVRGNPDVSVLVKTLRIRILWATRAPILSKDRRVACATALGGLHALETLELELLADRNIHLLPHLPRTAFPRLRTLIATLSHDLGPFLRAHPSIERLSVGGPRRASHYRLQIPPVRLPLLRVFEGPEVLARAVIPGSRVVAPTVWWDPKLIRRTPHPNCLAFLARPQTGSVAELCSVMNGWGSPKPTFVAANIPRVNCLRFRNLRRDSSQEQRERFLADLLAALPSLRRLSRLVLEEPCRRPADVARTFDGEWKLLWKWSDACPSLEDCTMLSGVRWQRSSMAQWLPVEGQPLESSQVFASWFATLP